jgi:hypothetical protein
MFLKVCESKYLDFGAIFWVADSDSALQASAKRTEEFVFSLPLSLPGIY